MTSGPKASHEAEPTRWESVVDQAIREAQERGEFDDLPGTGRPLPVDDHPFAGDWALAFRAMKNAGVVPPWMELGREVGEGLAGLKEMREQAGRYGRERVSHARDQATSLDKVGEASRHGNARRSGWRWWWQRIPDVQTSTPPTSGSRVAGLEAERERVRARYVERAAAVDKKIAAYNAALPNDLWRLRRGLVTAAAAARDFDAVWPPAGHED